MGVRTLVTGLVAAMSVFAAGGCQTAFVDNNKPLTRTASGDAIYTGGYSLLDMVNDPKGEILLGVAFSGGGKRSAAFGHGALRGLRDITVLENGERRHLLDEVDYIAAVSGGSFPAMHYGLFRDRSFETFPSEFLYQDIEAYIYGTYLLPWNWEWLFNPYYGTNDRMAEIYDGLMFHGATYADLKAKGLPVISVNATDIANGLSFAFVQPYFSLICSDLLKFRVARAVAASNGFPVVFSPVTLTSFRSKCGAGQPPGLVAPHVYEAPENESRIAVLGRSQARYLDPEKTAYVHLMDGGIADNLAMRAMLNSILSLNVRDPAFQRIARITRRVVVISVDGQAATDPTLPRKQVVTGLGQIFSAVSGSQIDSYNYETILLAEQQTQALTEEVKAARCALGRELDGHPCDDVQGAFIHISLSNVKDAALRERLQAIPTGLTIPKPDVDSLVALGEELVRSNEELRNVLAGFSVQVAPAAAPASERPGAEARPAG